MLDTQGPLISRATYTYGVVRLALQPTLIPPPHFTAQTLSLSFALTRAIDPKV